MEKNFDTAFAGFMQAAEKITADYNAKQGFKGDATLKAQRGSKYVKVIREGSVHCFVEIATGNILKAASYKVPAKGTRGSIYAEDFGASCMNAYGADYRDGSSAHYK